MESQALSHRSEAVGRRAELAAISEFAARVGEGPRVLVLEGEAGIGKTILWRAGVEEARRTARVLVCRTTETESSFVYAGLTDLLGGALDEVRPRLPGPQARALESALLRGGDAEVEARVVAAAALGALRALSEREPLVVAVDDLQWLDASSRRVLGYAVRRLVDEPVGLLASERPPSALARDVDSGLTHLRLGPLSLAATHSLVRLHTGISLERPTLVRIHQSSGGNPLLALELVRALGGERIDPRAVLPVPANVRTLVDRRLRRLPAGAREAVLATYALSRPTPALVEAALLAAGLDADGLGLAAEAEVVELGAGAAALAHPLLGSVLYGRLPPARRRALHGRLAGLPLDPVERARHRALAADGRDAAVAASVEEAASEAAARGAPEAAAELLELALRLTPEDDRDARERRRLAHLTEQYKAGDIEPARAGLRELAADAQPGPTRARALLSLVQSGETRYEESERLLRRALADAAGDDSLQARIETMWARSAWWAGLLETADGHATRAVELAERADDVDALLPALAQAATIAAYLGRPGWLDLLDRGVALESSARAVLPLDLLPRTYRASLCEFVGDVDRARRYFDEVLALARERGDQAALATSLALVCQNECRAGRIDAAERAAEEGAEQARRSSAFWEGTYRLAYACVAACRGDEDAARTAAREAIEIDERKGIVPVPRRARALLAQLELAAGRPAEALAWVDDLYRTLRREGYVEPSGYRFLPEQAEALVQLGRLDEAERMLEPFAEAAARTDRRWARAAADRCRGLLLAARGEGDEALAALARAVELGAAAGQPFEHGRALLTQGVVARRLKRKALADEALRRAEAVFEELGNGAWAARARAERARVGLRPRAPGELTETERRVAELAAAGRRNAGIASELFMSVRAVEANLTRAYRKLGIRSRSELAARLATGDGGAGPEETPA